MGTKAIPPAEQSAYDAMATVFDTLLVPEAAPAAEAEPEVEPKPEAESAPEPAPESTPAPEAEVAPEVTSEPEPEPEAKAEPAEDWEAKYRALEEKLKAPPAAEPASTPPVETPPPDIYAAEEKEFLATYEKEWPDVAKGEALRRRKEYGDLVAYVFKEIARVYNPLVLRGTEAADAVAETTALAAVRAVHNDYDLAMYNDVLKWADGLSGIRKKVAQATIEEGDPQDVVDLITEFKTATGRKARVTAGAAPAAPAATVTDLSAKAKQAAKALGVVDSKRTAPVSGQADVDDFDAAWMEAVGGK